MGAEREALGRPDERPEGVSAGGAGEVRAMARGEGVLPHIDGYQVVGVLGRGATGVVYSAVQLAVDRPVALKVLLPELVGSKRAVRRMQREARTAAKLAHPGIISAIDMGEQDGLWWYAMELVEGISLAERLEERGPLTEREALRLFIPLVEALQHACEAGVVHRDVKPANILIDARGRARLVDLGLAFAEDDPMLTKAGGTLGTPHYISPEQARDPSAADSRSDIWSLGATLYHALCGRPPFEGESVAEILSGVLYHPVPDPRVLAPHLSRGVALVLRKCLTRDPERRYREPAQLLRDLERLRERRAPHVQPAQLEPVAGGRPAWVLWAVGAAAVALLALVALRPWAGGRREVAQGPALQASWAWLENIEEAWSERRYTLAEALGWLESGPATPPGWEKRRGDLEVSLTRELQARLATLVREVDAELDRLLTEGRIAEAAAWVEDGVRGRLRADTGYQSLADLPQGPLRQEHREWLGLRRRRVEQERQRAVRQARSALAAHFDRLSETVQQSVRDGRWGEALEMLAPREAWLDDVAAAAGLPDEDRRGLLEDPALEGRVRAEVGAARGDWLRRDGELAAGVAEEFELLRARVEEAQVSGAAEALRDAFRFEAERLGIDPGQVPEAWRPGAAARRLEDLAKTLGDLERASLEEVVRDRFEVDGEQVDGLCRRRRYGQALALWEDRLRDELLVSVRDVREAMDRRRREAELLQGLLDRAVTGVRPGQSLSLLLDGFQRDVVVRSNADSGGFNVQGEVLFRVHLVPPASLPSTDRVLGSGDLLRLAGLGGADATPVEALQRALFLFFEGEYQAALDGLPSARFEGEDLLPDLRARVRAALRAESEAARRREDDKDNALKYLRLQRERGGSTPQALLDDIEALLRDHGDLLDDEQRGEVEGLRREIRKRLEASDLESTYRPTEILRSSAGQLDVTLVWDLATGEAGAWLPGDWTLDRQGLVLLAVRDEGAFLDPARNPRLRLRPPFDPGQGFELRLEMSAVAADPQGVLEVVLRLGEVQAVFVDTPRRDAFLAGRDDVRQLLDRARTGADRRSGGFEGFPRGRPFELIVALDPRRGDLSVRVDGEPLRTVNVGREELGARWEPEVGLHALRPMEVSRITLAGKRLRQPR